MKNKPNRRAVFALFLVVWAGGLAARAGADRTAAPEASVTALGLRIERIAWLADHMEHGRLPMPASMMPDMPVPGQHRLSVEVTIHNRGQERQLFRVAELELRSSAGARWTPSSTTTDTLALRSGQLAHLVLQFDVPAVRGDHLRLVWQRGRREQVMRSIPLPPAHSTTHHPSDDHG